MLKTPTTASAQYQSQTNLQVVEERIFIDNEKTVAQIPNMIGTCEICERKLELRLVQIHGLKHEVCKSCAKLNEAEIKREERKRKQGLASEIGTLEELYGRATDPTIRVSLKRKLDKKRRELVALN